MEPYAPRRIVAATDFSEVSTWALRHAVMWAQRCQAELTLLHAQDFPPIGTDPYFGSYSPTELVEATEQAITQQLAEYVEQHVPPDVAVQQKLMTGPPAAVIEEYAASTHADLVVLGTHGRGGVSQLLLGSVAERALRMAQRPTLIVRQLEGSGHAHSVGVEALSDSPPRLQQILCPVNYTDVARSAFEHACGVARTFGAGLTVVFAVEPTEGSLAARAMRDAEERLRAWLPIEPAAECQMQPIVRHGDAGEQVITLAREAKVDLVVIGAQHRRFIDTTVLGVTTVRVTRHAPCPVLVVPRPA